MIGRMGVTTEGDGYLTPLYTKGGGQGGAG